MKKIIVVQVGRRNDYEVANALSTIGALKVLVSDFIANSILVYASKLIIKIIKNNYLEKICLRRPREANSIISAYNLFKFSSARRLSLDNQLSAVINAIPADFQEQWYYFLSECAGVRSKFPNARIILEIVLSQSKDICLLEHALSIKNNNSLANELHLKKHLLRLERDSIVEADYFIFPSEYVCNEIKSKYNLDQQRCKVVPYWCPDVFSNFPVNVKNIAPNETLKVIFVGRLTIIKGFDIFLEVADAMSNENICFDVVGSGPMHEINQNKIPLNPRGNVTFYGHVEKSELDKIYRSAHVFLFPTRNEGSALVSYEALSYGLPMITTTQCGSILTDEVHGIVSSTLSSEEIIKQLRRIINDPQILSHWSRNCLDLASKRKRSDYHDRVRVALSEFMSL